MATNSSNMKNGFVIYMGLSSLSIVQKVVVAICGKIPQWKIWTSEKKFQWMFWKTNEVWEDRVAVVE